MRTSTPGPQINDPELFLEWIAQVRGRSERTHARTPVLMILGFLAGADRCEAHARGFWTARYLGLHDAEIETILECESRAGYTYEELAGLIEYYGNYCPDWPRELGVPAPPAGITLAGWLQ